MTAGRDIPDEIVSLSRRYDAAQQLISRDDGKKTMPPCSLIVD
jgi:hypothetical protein